jgi:hypothetical protein
MLYIRAFFFFFEGMLYIRAYNPKIQAPEAKLLNLRTELSDWIFECTANSGTQTSILVVMDLPGREL